MNTPCISYYDCIPGYWETCASRVHRWLCQLGSGAGFGLRTARHFHHSPGSRFPCSYLYTAHLTGDMKAVHISKEGRELVDRPVPEPAAGEVLIRSTFAWSLSFPD